MQWTNTRERYGLVAQLLHWATAILILALIPLGLWMVWLPADTSEAVATKVWLYSLHKTLGVSVLAVALARVAWAFFGERPQPLHPERGAETLAAETVHWLLYAGIILTPLTGLLHHYATIGFAPIWWPLPQDLAIVPKSEQFSIILKWVHWGTALMIIVALGAHIAGAMKHLVIDRDDTVARMVPGAKCDPQISAISRHSHAPTWIASGLVVATLFASVGYAMVDSAKQPQSAAVSVPADTSMDGDGAMRWQIDHDASRLAITVVQLGTSVDGAFGAWAADIVFDPENLDTARVSVAIDIASLSVGTVSSQAIGSDFLDAENHPEARFVADSFRSVGEGAYEAEGTLTIRGVAQPLILPFTLAIDGDTARMAAAVTVNRIDFGVGAESYGNEDSVAFGIDVTVELTASRIVPTGES